MYGLTQKFPNDERFRLVDQLRRAAISSTANIAEGFGRYHYQENIQFCRQSRGSLFEILDHLIASADLGYVPKEEFQEGRDKVLRAVKVLNGYLKMLQKAKNAQSETDADGRGSVGQEPSESKTR